MTELETITDARLTALETLLQRLYAMTFAKMPADDLIRIKRELIFGSDEWTMFPGAPPQDVGEIEQSMKLVGFAIRNFVNQFDEREQDVRKSSGLSPADLPDKKWS